MNKKDDQQQDISVYISKCYCIKANALLLQLGEYTEAEDALCEANMLNNMDAEVWAYLSLVCLKTGRQVEAEQSFKFAIKVFINCLIVI